MNRRAVLLTFIALGCRGKESRKHSESVDDQSSAPQSGESPSRRGPKQTYRSAGSVTLEEVKGLFPVLGGARVLQDPRKAERGERVVAGYCFDQGEPAQAVQSVVSSFVSAGWENVTQRAHQSIKDRINVSGRRDAYVLFGQVDRAAHVECDGAKGQTYVTIGVHKMEERHGPPPTVVGPRGPMMRPPALLRPQFTPSREDE